MPDPAVELHPAVASWLAATFGAPTEPQARGWPAIQAGRHTLIAAPTGSGKTLAAFLCAIDALVRRGIAGELADATYVVYVSPLKALSNDIEKNLVAPLAGIREKLAAMGLPDVDIRTGLRTGDTAASQRSRMTKKPPHIFVTTPESLYILLTSVGGRRMLQSARTVIVDEIHAMVADKRGTHLALSLERLDALTGRPLQRIGLSATQKPILDIARFLVGTKNVSADGAPDCTVIDHGHARARDIAIEVPSSPLESVMSGEVWTEVYDRLAALVREHKTTLVFVNTRRLAERVSRYLSERLGVDRVTSHHGSLSREHRLAAEQRLKAGTLSALVATASLELGIDIGDVDLVCQVGSTRSIAAFLQRVGRSGHQLRGVPKGRLFPLSRDDLVDSAALIDATRRGELDRLRIPEAPLDILAQQIIAATAAGTDADTDAGAGWSEAAMLDLVRGAWPYRDLPREKFDDVVAMVAHGFATARGRRAAHIHHDGVNGRLSPRKHARITAITCGGAIPDVADYEVILEPAGVRVGTLHEDFAIESTAGDIFQLGNASYLIRRVEPGKVRVEDAAGQPPTLPFWLGEAPARTAELSHAISRLRKEVADQIGEGGVPLAVAWLRDVVGIGEAAGAQIADYVAATVAALGVMPTEDTLVLERFFDETGGMHVVLHAPLGGRINRALGLALRKCFCRKFDFELQAAANEDALVLSLGPTHSFPLSDVWSYLKSGSVREVLVQALLAAPMFGTRWRWNASRALAVLRFRGGKKVPARLQRMDAEDLLTVCFPDQVACQENVVGDREIPDHPLVQQTVNDCLTEAMDIDGLKAVIQRIEQGTIGLVTRDVTEPSPLAAGILNARPYAFLDDAPLEERRTQAVLSRRWLDPAQASDLGALDAAAVQRVTADAWPEPRDAEELCDALSLLGVATEEEVRRGAWGSWLEGLRASGRATLLDAAQGLWVMTERAPEARAVYPKARFAPEVTVPARYARDWTREDALREIVRSRLESSGPVTVAEVARTLSVPAGDVDAALTALEVEGVALRGAFRPGAAPGTEFCERRLLARIHRATLQRLRSEIEPVTTADFIRFAIGWQRASDETRAQGPAGLAAVVDLLEGFEAPAGAWETEILPARVREYDPAWLDSLCLAGRVVWLRRSPSQAHGRASGPVRATPIAIVPRASAGAWQVGTFGDATEGSGASDGVLSADAASVLAWLESRGASFHGDIVHGARLLPSALDAALGQLVTRGRVTSDGFSGLRALVTPADKRRAAERHGRRSRRGVVAGMESAGRWSVLPQVAVTPEYGDDHATAVGRALLRRWGIVFRKVVEREGALPAWRDILRAYRRMEARGELRGGRFVDGVTGEQYALPEAVGALREARRKPKTGALVAVSAVDPLNLVGILTPGERVPAITKSRVLYRDGVPVAVREGGVTRIVDRESIGAKAEIEQSLVKLPSAKQDSRRADVSVHQSGGGSSATSGPCVAADYPPEGPPAREVDPIFRTSS